MENPHVETMASGANSIELEDQIKLQRLINDASHVLSFFKIYGLLIFFPAFVVGAFVGPPVLIASIAHLCLFLLSVLAKKLLLQRSRFGRWLTISIGSLVIVACLLMIRGLWIEDEQLVVMLFPISFLLLSLFLVVVLLRRDIANFFK